MANTALREKVLGFRYGARKARAQATVNSRLKK